MAVSWQQINYQVDLTIWAIFGGKKSKCFWNFIRVLDYVSPPGRTNAEAQVPLLWPPDGKSWLTTKDPDPGKVWRQEEKGTAENEIVRWHHQFNGHEFEQTPVSIKGQGSLESCSLWGHKGWETERLSDWTTRGGEFLVQEVKMLLEVGCGYSLFFWKWKVGQKKNCYLISFSRISLHGRNL